MDLIQMFLFAGEPQLTSTFCKVMFVIDIELNLLHCMEGISAAAMDETFWCWIVEGDNPLVEQPLYIGT